MKLVKSIRSRLIRLLPRYWQVKLELYQDNRLYRKLIAMAEKSGKYSEARDLHGEWGSVTQHLEIEHDSMKTVRLTRKARRLGAFIPKAVWETTAGGFEEDREGYWEDRDGRRILTDKGFAEILKNIRTARKGASRSLAHLGEDHLLGTRRWRSWPHPEILLGPLNKTSLPDPLFPVQ